MQGKTKLIIKKYTGDNLAELKKMYEPYKVYITPAKTPRGRPQEVGKLIVRMRTNHVIQWVCGFVACTEAVLVLSPLKYSEHCVNYLMLLKKQRGTKMIPKIKSTQYDERMPLMKKTLKETWEQQKGMCWLFLIHANHAGNRWFTVEWYDYERHQIVEIPRKGKRTKMFVVIEEIDVAACNIYNTEEEALECAREFWKGLSKPSRTTPNMLQAALTIGMVEDTNDMKAERDRLQNRDKEYIEIINKATERIRSAESSRQCISRDLIKYEKLIKDATINAPIESKTTDG